MTKTKEPKGLTYKGKPLTKNDNIIYYGNPADKYILCMIVESTETINDLEVSKKVIVQLEHNVPDMNPKKKIIKRVERDGLYKAMDVGMFWLEDALSNH